MHVNDLPVAQVAGWAWTGAVLFGAILVGLFAHALLFWLLRRAAARTPHLFLEGRLLTALRRPTRLLLPILFLYAAHPLLAGTGADALALVLSEILYVVLVLCIGWLVLRAIRIIAYAYTSSLDVESADNLRARQMQTRVAILQRIAGVIVVLLMLAAIMLHYESFREIGTGLLASAGVAGIVLGFAAQRTLGNLIAGFQIAFTQPIRVDDVVVVEDEWGRIEEITLSYVVVRIWDQRRLILPISYFIEKPFQNWTRISADILATVFLYVDYTVPVEAVREELHRLLQQSEYWDGIVCRLHVTDTTERTVQLRALMSARNSGDAFELRCEIREKLIDFLQKQYPHALPVIRASFQNENGSAGA